MAGFAEQAAETAVVLRRMRQQLVLVAAMEGDDGRMAEAALAQGLPVGMGEHAGEEVLPQDRIVQPAFFFHR